jgi:phospholipase C
VSVRAADAVPMIIGSPWTGRLGEFAVVRPHLLDPFLETRFANGGTDLIESSITPWQCAVTGDLTSAFGFAKPNSPRGRPARHKSRAATWPGT